MANEKSTKSTITGKEVSKSSAAAGKPVEVPKSAGAIKPSTASTSAKPAAAVKPSAASTAATSAKPSAPATTAAAAKPAAAAKTATAKKTETASKPKAAKTTKKKTTGAKPAAKSAENVVEEVYFEYNSEQILAGSIVEKVKEEYKNEGHRVSGIKTLRIYINPEEKKAYYVINDKAEGKFVEF